MTKTVTIDFHGKPLTMEVGRLAKQANGSALIRFGDTVVLSAAVTALKDREGLDFLPLTVDYFEKFPSAGKIPGGFFRREGRPTEGEILISRLCDRPIRPLFPKGYRRETQITSTVYSFDGQNESDVLAILGTSLAIHVSDIPVQEPIGAIRVGRNDGKFIANPTRTDLLTSDIDMIVAATKDAILMVEGESSELSEEEVLDALMFAFKEIAPLIQAQEEIRKAVGKPKIVLPKAAESDPLKAKVRGVAQGRLAEALSIVEKLPRYRKMAEIEKAVSAEICVPGSEWEGKEGAVAARFSELQKEEIRSRIVKSKTRIDRRSTNEIRSITCEIGLLPRTHGSALFTRGETQALVTATLGTGDDEQRIDSLRGESFRHFMLHYNFPAFSVGEVKPNRGPGRREIGHGALAHRAIAKMLPDREKFPYTIRIVSDVLESHGSSSMATVCGASLALMDAGVPIRSTVAGIAMGLVKEGEDISVLSDISGDEDHIGDMDFKVAGTAKGITAIQMDIKISGISREILELALHQAKEGRLFVLDRMATVIQEARPQLSPFAPRIETIQIKIDKIREIIGPGGKMIRSIVERSGAKVDIEDSGKISIASADLAALQKARELIEAIIAEPEMGRIYKGKVRRIMEYGAFVEIMPGTDGLVHISEIHNEGGRVDRVEDVVKEGDEIEVKIINIDHQGKIKLSHREAVAPGSAPPPQRDFESRRPMGDRDSRGPRGGQGQGGGRGPRPPRPRRDQDQY